MITAVFALQLCGGTVCVFSATRSCPSYPYHRHQRGLPLGERVRLRRKCTVAGDVWYQQRGVRIFRCRFRCGILKRQCHLPSAIWVHVTCECVANHRWFPHYLFFDVVFYFPFKCCVILVVFTENRSLHILVSSWGDVLNSSPPGMFIYSMYLLLPALLSLGYFMCNRFIHILCSVFSTRLWWSVTGYGLRSLGYKWVRFAWESQLNQTTVWLYVWCICDVFWRVPRVRCSVLLCTSYSVRCTGRRASLNAAHANGKSRQWLPAPRTVHFRDIPPRGALEEISRCLLSVSSSRCGRSLFATADVLT